MPRSVPSVRIFPMSERRAGFRGRAIEDVQRRVFLRDLPLKCDGRWRYASSGLNAVAGTVVLFQFRARVIASAVFLRDEKFARPKRGSVRGRGGVLHFDPAPSRTRAPLAVP